MFQRDYALLDAAVVCEVLQTTATFKHEINDMYPYIKKLTARAGWVYHRIDVLEQKGFPDIVLFRRGEYWLIEAKILKKKALVKLEDDLGWQFGQIGFMRKALLRNLNYMLAVGKGSSLAFIKGANTDAEQFTDYPDFIRLF